MYLGLRLRIAEVRPTLLLDAHVIDCFYEFSTTHILARSIYLIGYYYFYSVFCTVLTLPWIVVNKVPYIADSMYLLCIFRL